MLGLIQVRQVCFEGRKEVSDKRTALIDFLCLVGLQGIRTEELEGSALVGRARKGGGIAWFSRMAGASALILPCIVGNILGNRREKRLIIYSYHLSHW